MAASTSPASLDNLPLELQRQIFSGLSGTDMFATYRNLHALWATSQHFRYAITQDAEWDYDTLRLKVNAANAHVSVLLSAGIDFEGIPSDRC